MLFKMTELKYKPNPVLERALGYSFHFACRSRTKLQHQRHAQHRQFAGRSLFGCAGAAAALYGPLHGGANEAVLRMLMEIGSKDKVPEFIKRSKAAQGRLMGFGHRVYKNYDPRATHHQKDRRPGFRSDGDAIRCSKSPWSSNGSRSSDEYFIKRKLYPNVDFYSGLIYQSMGLPMDMFPVLFAIPRTIGWIAQWEEMLTDPDQKLARPKQIYLGAASRDFVEMSKRK